MSKVDWSRFDRKVLVTCPSQKNRHEHIFREMSRVGLGDVEIVCQSPSPYAPHRLRGISAMRPDGPMARHPQYADSVYSHYSAIKTAYELGCQNVLVMENDIRFLKDLSELQMTIDELPCNFDLALFDSWFKPKWTGGRKFSSPDGRRWTCIGNAFSAGCYALSRRGMEMVTRFIEDPMSGSGFFRTVDTYWKRRYWFSGAVMLAATPNAVVQEMYPNSLSGGGNQGCYAMSSVVDFSVYASYLNKGSGS